MDIDTKMPFRRFEVVYGKSSNRVHKRWEFDGTLFVQNTVMVLQNNDSTKKQVAACYFNNKIELENLGRGHRVNIGGYELEVQDEIFEHEYSNFKFAHNYHI